ncbi:glutathione S-transferase family protein [Litorivicinus sp.]|jgi:glutathione S-transferase|nr:glutathione S-transferase family protein [Litorivicinus sp.]MDC1207749.1 glutathione S-transferase family protein [Litorivicinus sp.]|tara:strand:+ start:977 stop:1627 length:651 start_codon:yes stop_codon:yes gene_type:complete
MLMLYDLPISSYGCKIRILLRHKALPWTSIAPPDGYGSPAYCELVPSGTIPALNHDGFILAESEAIAEYINELVPDPVMLPENIQDRATARALSRLHDTRIEPLLRAYFSQISPEHRDIGFIRENAALLENRLTQLAKIVSPAPFMTGNELSLADCGFVSSFAILHCVQALLGFELAMPQTLRNYERALCAHPSVRDEHAAYIRVLDDWAGAKLRG